MTLQHDLRKNGVKHLKKYEPAESGKIHLSKIRLVKTQSDRNLTVYVNSQQALKLQRNNVDSLFRLVRYELTDGMKFKALDKEIIINKDKVVAIEEMGHAEVVSVESKGVNQSNGCTQDGGKAPKTQGGEK